MGYLIFNERGAEHFERALMKAKKGIEDACDIFDEMEEKFGERDDYNGESYDGRFDGRWDYGERDYGRMDGRGWGERRGGRRRR